MAATNDFSLRPFHLGTIIGVRSFKISGDKLLGPVYPTEFAPGQNMAECHRIEDKIKKMQGGQDAIYSHETYAGLPAGVQLGEVHFVYAGTAGKVGRRPMPANAKMGLERLLGHFVTSSVHGDGLGDDAKTLTIPPPLGLEKIEPKLLQEKIDGADLTDEEMDQIRAEHVATKGCTCGFYAYFDRGYNSHHAATNALGLIEGYGVVTVGERGFRAQKARLLCLIEPEGLPGHPGSGTMRSTWPTLLARYQVPSFRTLDLALAEYPLTPPDVEEEEED